MSQTFHLCCPETKKEVWVGQGWGVMESFYSGDERTMQALGDFLREHEDKPLVLLELSHVPIDFEEYKPTAHNQPRNSP